MIRSQTFLTIAAFALAGVLAVVTSILLAIATERRSVELVEAALNDGGMTWAEVSANGLRVYLDGTAPSEASAFRASSRAGAIVDADRLITRIEVARREDVAPPRFSVDILRGADGIQVIGLVPAETGIARIDAAMAVVADGLEVTNLVETADYPVPESWTAALDYGLRALQELPRSKVTVYADAVEVQAIAESAEERTAFLRSLETGQPEGVEVMLDISAPRPVITPFTLRFVIDAAGARFETCAADTEAARTRILAAAEAAGAEGPLTCQIGLGVPSPQWGQAVVAGIGGLSQLGGGTVAFSDADVTLIAAPGTEQDRFDRVIGELSGVLPDVFSLDGVLPEPSDDTISAGPARLIATLNEEGVLTMRGRLPDGPVGRSVEAYARALFGMQTADIATRAVTDLPGGWSMRAMAGLDALSQLSDGTMVLEPETLILRGRTGNRDAVSDLTRLLAEALGQTASFELDVNYVEALDPVASQPTPEQCVERIRAIQAEGKITFDPGSVEINESAGAILDRIAGVLPDCRHVRMEISGHTDSQGREEMNLNLSQSRADAVLNGLLARNVLVSNLTAQGYGESQPIASNETEDGREQNRRIEFRLLAAAGDGIAADGNEPGAGDDGAQATGDGGPQRPGINPVPRPDSVVERAEAAAEAAQE
ncbi:OmpA family protein [Rhodobacterales bacterium HKCCSP123]|nr:OmpA family protein [Rhodobacterales bacterium HKCCSP123]